VFGPLVELVLVTVAVELVSVARDVLALSAVIQSLVGGG
jgi:hypothetical protein